MEEAGNGLKTCSKCKQTLPLTEFFRNKNRRDGFWSSCKVCDKARNERYRLHKNVRRLTQGENRNSHLRLTYGITPEDYDDLFAQQGGVCLICRKAETWQRKGSLIRLSVDHDHVTGQVRGLLCYRCNTALGLLGEDIVRMTRAIEYLKQSMKQRKLVQMELFKEAR